MIIICAHKYDWRNFCLFLGTDGSRCLCSMADFGWLSVINRSATSYVGARPCGFGNLVQVVMSVSGHVSNI